MTFDPLAEVEKALEAREKAAEVVLAIGETILR